MTLAAFQRALCDLIGSPELCLAARADPDAFLSRYDLSPRERDRLADIVWQPGMSTNCSLYRSNRVTPIYTLLHYTCLVLGDSLKSTLEAYWSASELRDLEFEHEIHRFARFLRERIERGTIVDPFVEEVLEFEVAVNELRFAPRRRILRELQNQESGHTRVRVHPLMRVVRFRHEPAGLLAALAEGRVPRDLPEAESFLLLGMVDGSLTVQAIDAAAGRRLDRLRREGGCAPPAGLEDLMDLGILVRTGTTSGQPASREATAPGTPRASPGT